MTHATNVYAVDGSTATPGPPASYAAPPAEVPRVTFVFNDRTPDRAVPFVGVTRVPVPYPYQPRADVSKPTRTEWADTSRWSAARLAGAGVACFDGVAPSVVVAKPAKRSPDAASDESEYRVKRRRRLPMLPSSVGHLAPP